MPLNPEDEDAIWGQAGNAYPASGSPRNNTLNYHFPELIRAGGQVDPMEAVASLLDRIKQLEAKVNGTDTGRTPSRN